MPADPAATRRLIESLSTHLEEHLATWKSSLVDARRDIETLLAAVSEKIPAHAKPLFPENIVSLILEDVMPAPPPPPPPPPKVVERVVPAPPAPADWTLVRGALSSIESARTQVDVLTRFITQASAHASRVALLVLRNDRVTGWKAIGFDASGGHDESVRTIDLGAEDDPFAAEVLRAQRSRVASPPDEASALRAALGGRPPARALLVPMVIRDRLAGLVWADELPGEEGRLNEAAVEVLTFVTGLAVDLLAARKKIPSPTLTPTGESIEAFRPAAAAPTRPPAPVPEATPAFEVVSASKPVRPPEIREAPRTVAPPEPLPAPASLSGIRPRPKDAEEQIRKLEESAARRRRAAAASVPPGPPSLTIPAPAPPAFPGPPAGPPPGIPPAVTAAATIAVPSLGGPPPPPPLVPTRPPSTLPPPLTQASTGDFTQAFEALRAAGAVPPAAGPPTGATPMFVPDPAAAKPRPGAPGPGSSQASAPAVRPISGFIPRSKLGTDVNSRDRQIDDARRLARLLISEIKLYNEKKVDEGRAASDLYERLKDDIDRSRQVYEERTPESVRKEKNFFQEELVRILADGRAEALGPMP